MKLTMDLQNKSVLITGASAGLGVEFARQCHAGGATVTLVARRGDLLQKIVDELNIKRPASADFIACDLGQNVQPVIDFIKATRVDILVNNAGRGSFGYFDNLSIEEELQMVALNVAATLKIAHAVIPQMKARGSGVIIAVSSIVAFQALPYMATYSATKSFNLAHALALRHELSDFGIKVIALCPGPTETEFGGVARIPGTLTGVPRDSAAAVVSTCLSRLDQNPSIIVPSLKSKLLSYPSKFLPRTVCSWLGKKALISTLKQVTNS